MIKVSVIIPIYNVEKYLRKCIESVIAQTLEDIQIICVDDGSKDNCGKICDEYAKKDRRVTVIHKKNGGLVTARKAGLAVAAGKYIGFVDGDDWVEPEMYEHMYNLAEKYQVSFVETGVIDSSDNGYSARTSNFNEGCYKDEDYEKLIVPRLMCFGEFYRFGLTPFVWNKLYRPELLKECYGKIDDKNSMFEDVACSYPYAVRSSSVYISHKCLYHYRIVINSMKRIVRSDVYNVLIEQCRLVKEAYENSRYRECLMKQLDYYIIYASLWNCPQVFDDLENGEILVPFGGISQNEKIVLYGAGAAGIHLNDYIVNKTKVNVVLWVDSNYEEIGKEFDVKSPDCIKIIEYDKIIIAVFREQAVKSVKKWLADNGVCQDKICWIHEKYIRHPELLTNKMGLN